LSTDNAFLYAFGSYAESVSPLQISRVADGKIRVVTGDPEFRGYLLQEIARMEFMASLEGSYWRSNPFLAAWVATKSLIGEGESAWSTMLTNYDRQSDWSNEECLTEDLPVHKCPAQSIRKVSFPEALKKLLIANGYKIDFSKVAVDGSPRTNNAPHDSLGSASLLQRCVASLPTVQTLAIGTFTGLEEPPQTWRQAVVIEDNATVDDYDEKINKLTCSASYRADLRELMGLVAQDAQIDAVNKLNAMRQRLGPTVSNRLRFTVQPTSRPGVPWVNLLP
jgi:hypothetical protein